NPDAPPVVVDFTAPEGLNSAPVLTEGHDTGVQGDYTTTEKTHTFSSEIYGLLEAGTYIGLIWDKNNDGVYQPGGSIDMRMEHAKVEEDGTWTFDYTFDAGKYHIGFIQWDEAGNYTRLGETVELDIISKDISSIFASTGWNSPMSSNYIGSAVTLGQDGLYQIYNTRQVISKISSSTQTISDLSKPAGASSTNPSHATYADFDRSGSSEIFASDSSASNGLLVWSYNGNNYTASFIDWEAGSNAPVNGGIIALDANGDGYLDLVYGDGLNLSSTSGGLIFNEYDPISGPAWTWAGAITEGANPIVFHRELSGVDLDNDGAVDIVAHIGIGDTDTSSTKLGVLINDGDGGFTLNQNIGDIFISTDGNSYSPTSMTWADFDGDGYLDLYLNYVVGSDGASRIYLNNGDGTLNESSFHPLQMDDELWGGFSLAVDWNQDGKMDIIELSMNNKTSNAVAMLYTNTGVEYEWGSHELTNNLKHITGALLVDYNWDGALDLLVTQGEGVKTAYIENTNRPKEGTSLHLKILDQDGLNVFYGNTVQLFDSAGNLVSTQVLNPQSGIGVNDSTGMVHFYGLDQNETYTVKLYRTVEGTAEHVVWTNLSTTDSSSYVLSAQGGNSTTLNKTFTGTGYNDTFIAEVTEANEVITYNGSGGWSYATTAQSSWNASGGMDIVDFSQANSNITVDLRDTNPQLTGLGAGQMIFNDIEGLRGGSGNDTFYSNGADNLFEGRGGNDTFYLGGAGSSGHDTLFYRIIDIDAVDGTGGNGSDTAKEFGLGNTHDVTDADIIDLRELLYQYSGTAYTYWDEGNPDVEGDEKWVLDKASQGLLDYLQVEIVSGNTQISVNLDGSGNDYALLLTLEGVESDLATLLANNQLLVASSAFDNYNHSNTSVSVEGGAGNESFILSGSGHTTLIYQLLEVGATDRTGGNGHDDITGFHLGSFATDANADRIDLSQLLSGTGINENNIGEYVSVEQQAGNTVIKVDLDGTVDISSPNLVTLNDVDTTLTELLNNQQLVLY
ncbi:FG-GAP-like repeat-containing protein, partial [Desulfococcaceae bacterium OttesenSCG-928-F15]|nr:FG-GAP-like repeat-containing protein [Desulfococcaceae bacterium OttesenSCG-928-F15]